MNRRYINKTLWLWHASSFEEQEMWTPWEREQAALSLYSGFQQHEYILKVESV